MRALCVKHYAPYRHCLVVSSFREQMRYKYSNVCNSVTTAKTIEQRDNE
jgi:hypothetical protein